MGQEKAGGAPYDPDEPPPKPLGLGRPETPSGPATDKLVEEILKEIDGLAPRQLAGNKETPPESEIPLQFAARDLAGYEDASVKPALSEAIGKAVALLRRNQRALPTFFAGDPAAVKAQVLAQQQTPALLQLELSEVVSELEKSAPELNSPSISKRWRANYDLALGRLKTQIAFVYEYNFMLGQIRKDALPPKDPLKHSGWHMLPYEKIQSGTEARKQAADAKKIFERIAQEHRGTPWEVAAKRQRWTNLGLDWQPAPR